MKLYGYFRSSAAYRVRIALALKGLTFENIPINLVPGVSQQKSEDYRAVNPQGRVPFFEDGAVAISQSPAILEYLEETFPEVPLLPTGTADRAVVRQLASLIGCDIHPLNNLSVLQTLKHDFDASQGAVDGWYHKWILEGFGALEALLANTAGEFCFGDSPTLADIYLVPQVWNARRFEVPLSAFPLIEKVDAACNALEPFKKAAPENQPDAPQE
ncbi:MAG: maleylacetoacetate isomerase [Kordiimonadaceae bacterium]|nr:maleylacetoacetate isomerase [Kordiimonadaceae bacterium]MBO6570035.1 maleylacetoacetate isomerase [Kordiimonadaceae bacterium]MBO6965868.1 maleylacetoacetate isomerase [Kordiimonadaceae bacterium]